MVLRGVYLQLFKFSKAKKEVDLLMKKYVDAFLVIIGLLIIVAGREPDGGLCGRNGAQTESFTDTTKREKIPWQTIRSSSKVPASTT